MSQYTRYPVISGGGGSGTVTSVDLAAPASILTVSGNPVTTSGTLTLSLATQTANTVWAGPTSGGAATPTFRALVAADMPAGSAMSISTINSGVTAATGKTYLVDTSGGAISITLPAAAANLWFRIKDSTGSFLTNNVTIVRAASEKIEGIASNKIFATNWGAWFFVSNGTDWFLI